MTPRIHPRDIDQTPHPSFAQALHEEAKAVRAHDFRRARIMRLVKLRTLCREQRGSRG